MMREKVLKSGKGREWIHNELIKKIYSNGIGIYIRRGGRQFKSAPRYKAILKGVAFLISIHPTVFFPTCHKNIIFNNIVTLQSSVFDYSTLFVIFAVTQKKLNILPKDN